jgi:hypothetical protein
MTGGADIETGRSALDPEQYQSENDAGHGF